MCTVLLMLFLSLDFLLDRAMSHDPVAQQPSNVLSRNCLRLHCLFHIQSATKQKEAIIKRVNDGIFTFLNTCRRKVTTKQCRKHIDTYGDEGFKGVDIKHARNNLHLSPSLHRLLLCILFLLLLGMLLPKHSLFLLRRRTLSLTNNNLLLLRQRNRPQLRVRLPLLMLNPCPVRIQTIQQIL